MGDAVAVEFFADGEFPLACLEELSSISDSCAHWPFERAFAAVVIMVVALLALWE